LAISTTAKYKVLDIFSGIGGFSLGLQRAGMETVAFCEIEPYPVQVLKKNFPDILVHNDVRELTGDFVRERYGEIDLICGGFPCQDISIARPQNKEIGIKGERSGLWSEFRRLIDEIRPKFALIENVSALRGRGLNVILTELAKLRYDACYTMFDSQYFGVPQRRRRIYILAVRDGIPFGTDPFEFARRSEAECAKKVEHIAKGRRWDFTKGERVGEGFAFFTRQRPDEFATTGLSGTLAKRDYKSYIDLVVHENGDIRKVIPEERMLLQGFPEDWLISDGPIIEQFRCNGMTTNVVEWIGKSIIKNFAN